MAGLADYALAAQMRDVVNTLVQTTVERYRPRYRYATVVSIDRPARKCEVQYPGEAGTVNVNMGGVQPLEEGQVVRIDGLLGDRFISDVMGPIYIEVNGEDIADVWAGTWNAYTPNDSGLGLGNGLKSAAYMRLGQTCFFRYYFQLGSTSTVSNGASIGLPYKAATLGHSAASQQVISSYEDTSASLTQPGSVWIGRDAIRGVLIHDEQTNFGLLNNVTPYTWSTADRITATGVYEIDSPVTFAGL